MFICPLPIRQKKKCSPTLLLLAHRRKLLPSILFFDCLTEHDSIDRRRSFFVINLISIKTEREKKSFHLMILRYPRFNSFLLIHKRKKREREIERE